MAKTLQLRRGTTAEITANTPASGELFVDTQKKTVTVGDGSTAGGIILARNDRVSDVFTTANGANGLAAGAFTTANGANGLAAGAFTTANGANGLASGAYNQANVAIGVDTTQNTRINSIETINTNQNNSITIIQGVDSTQNVRLNSIETINTNQNNSITIIQGVNAGQNNTITAVNQFAASAFNQANTATAAADLSQVSEDILPLFSEVYDIGATDKRWYAGYFGDKIDIDNAEILGNEAGIFIPEALLTGELLFTDNLITPDSSSAIQYFGNKGVLVVNGNLDVAGDWFGTPVVETIQEILAAGAGPIDTNFNIGTGFNNVVTVIAIQSDGKIIVSGGFTSYNGTSVNRITRLNANGTRDTNFNIGTGFDGEVAGLSIQSDGKIVVGGYFASYNGVSQGHITRLNADGTIDTNFNFDVIIGTGFNGGEVTGLSIQSDGKIVVGGGFTSYNGVAANGIIRLKADGTRDTSFNIVTGFNGSVAGLSIQSDGKIVVGGSFTSYNGTAVNRITRLNADGTRDTNFNIGTGFNTNVLNITIQSDGKIIVGGNFTSYNGVAANLIIRLKADGTRDTNFNIGTGFNGSVAGLSIQSDGKIIVGGNFTSYNGTSVNRITRLNADGTIDTGFNIGTGFNTNVFNITIQSDGKIIVGGSFTSYNGTAVNRITRLNADIQGVAGFEVPLLGEEGMIRYNKDVSAFQGYDGTKWELLERVTTPPTSLQTTGTVDVDFSGATLRIQGPLTGNVTYTGSEYSAGNLVTIRVINGSTERALSFPVGWTFVGGKPTIIAADKIAILTLTSFGTTESDCVAAYAVQQ